MAIKGKVYTVDARKNLCTGFRKIFSKLSKCSAAAVASQWRYEKKMLLFLKMRASYQHKFAKETRSSSMENMQALELTYERN